MINIAKGISSCRRYCPGSEFYEDMGTQGWSRPTWLMEMIAECWGVFCYTYAGVGATAALVITTSAQEENLGGLLNVAVAYGFVVYSHLIVANFSCYYYCCIDLRRTFQPVCHHRVLFVPRVSTSQGSSVSACDSDLIECYNSDLRAHDRPSYIFAQCLGAFIAGICVWGQYHRELGVGLIEYHQHPRDTDMSRSNLAHHQRTEGSCPAGVVAIFPAAGASMGRVFLNEFIVDFFVSTNIIWPDNFAKLPLQLGSWACLDPANPFVSASSVPFAIGMAYTAMIIGFVPGTIATNAARDFGARCAAAAIWGRDAFPSPYSAISALTNIPAMLCSVMFYEFFLSDSSRVVVSHAETLHQNAQAHAHHRRLTNEMIGESPMAIKRELGRAMTGHQMTDSSSGGSKVEVDHREKV
ncbi:MIP domain-containing protein [Rhizoctonia solani AG-1 IA]|uniref:MIP domain-containing protein n=1 Tax=Thanatephorus cucumeris (strain AG1-IA) TaxID=983506 RepID=L8X0R0_THACA|nr:MIP domain-containing protein [Rhizoctonia solani AG-1 IA]